MSNRFLSAQLNTFFLLLGLFKPWALKDIIFNLAIGVSGGVCSVPVCGFNLVGLVLC